MFFRLFVIFTILPILELYLLIKIGGAIGALNTILIILVTASVGAYLAKSQGFMIFGRIQEKMNTGQMPGKELMHGLLILLGGFTLLTPGFITDIIGLTMLIPITRSFYLKIAGKIIKNKINTGEWVVRGYRDDF